MSVRLVSLLLLFATSELSAQDCRTAMTAPEVTAFIAGLDATAAVGSVWSDYTIANHPVVVISQPADTLLTPCAAIWRYRKPPVVVALSSRVRYSTPLYGMWNVDSITVPLGTGNSAVAGTLRRLPREAERALLDMGERRAVFLPVPLRLETLGAFGKTLQDMKVDVRTILLQLAVHESYHLHSQIPVWLGQATRYTWPAWDVQPDRQALAQRCYRDTPAVAAAHARELQLLIAAWDSLVRSPAATARSAALARARQFVEARRARYAMVDSIRISSPSGPVSCERAENLMELEEGAPQWMAYATLTAAGLMNEQTAGRSASEAFYVSGTFQLWILQRLLGRDAMRALSREITQASGPDSLVFARFSAVVTQR